MHRHGPAQRQTTEGYSIRNHRQHLSRTAVKRRRCLTCAAGADKLLVAALDKALTQITRILVEHEQQKQRKQLESGSKQAESPGKPIRFRAGSSGERLVQEVTSSSSSSNDQQQQPNRGLREYLALPLDQYSLLDPSWISRPDPVHQPDTFLLTVPLSDMMYVRLEPQVTIKVDIEPQNSQVQFHATSFRVGDERFDSSFNLNMTAVLSYKPIADVTPMGQSMAAAWKWLKQDNSNTTQAIAATTAATTITTSSVDGLATPVGSRTDSTTALNQDLGVRTDSLQADVACHDKPMTRGGVSSYETAAGVDATCDSDSSMNATAAAAHVSTATGLSTEGPWQEGASSHHHTNNNPGNESAHSTATDGSPDAGTINGDATNSSNSSAMLCCNVNMEFNVIVPSPLSVVPGPLLSAAGSLLARFCVQNMLPGFLELLSVDYGRWASGAVRGQKAGSLISATQPPASISAPLPLSSADIYVDVPPASQPEAPTQYHQSLDTTAESNVTRRQSTLNYPQQSENGHSSQQGDVVVDADKTTTFSYECQQAITQSQPGLDACQQNQNSMHTADKRQEEASTLDQQTNSRLDTKIVVQSVAVRSKE